MMRTAALRSPTRARRHAAPAYIAEMAPPQIRGTLVSLKEGGIVLGILLGYGVGYGFEHQEVRVKAHGERSVVTACAQGGWRYTYGLSSIMAVIMLLGVYQLPFSARWLVLQGHTEVQYACE